MFKSSQSYFTAGTEKKQAVAAPPAYEEVGQEEEKSGCGNPSCNNCVKQPVCQKPDDRCRVQVVQTCPPQTCSLRPPRIQCRFVLDKHPKCSSSDEEECSEDRDEECCNDRWMCDADTIVWGAIFLFVIFTVLAFVTTNGTFNISISALIGKLSTAFSWIVA